MSYQKENQRGSKGNIIKLKFERLQAIKKVFYLIALTQTREREEKPRMDRATAKEVIKNRISDYLQAIGQPKKNKDFVCPICNSGGGNNGNYTAAFKITPNGEAWHCFSCGNKGDIYSLIALQYGKDIKTDFAEILNIAAGALGVVIDNTDNSHYPQLAHKAQPQPEPQPEPQRTVDYSEFLKACKAEVTKTGYYKGRGLNDEIIERFNLGVVTDAILVKYKEACKLDIFRAGDLVIPYNRAYSYFIGRNPNIKPNEKGEFKHKKPKTEHAGREPIFNEAELDYTSKEPIFITEAPLDAISIVQAGGSAIAIGGTGPDKIEAAIDKRPQLQRSFIIAFDNPKQDNAGQTATEKLKAFLESRGIKYSIFKFADSVKDANEYLIKDERGFNRAVEESIAEAKQIAAEPERAAEPTENEIAVYNAASGAARLKGFINGIKESINTPPTATGFNSLDKILDGGLYEGLYILGAVSSLGKTTLLLQTADQIAKGGRDVLIFSLEMAAAELMAKSISRETFLICKQQGGGTANAKTVRGILDYSRYESYSREEKDTINKAIKNYSGYAGNIFINEGIGDIGIEQIKHKVTEHKKIRGKTPVIIIDYLQILAPYSDRASDKQNTDKAVLELKRIARDEKTPVLAISSFNRGNYSAGANMAAFKESGAIEYSSDVLIALQPCGMKEGEKDSDKAANAETMSKCKASTERNIEAVILKNRNGQTGSTAVFKYNAMFNCFEETEVKPPEWEEIHGLPSWEDLPLR